MKYLIKCIGLAGFLCLATATQAQIWLSNQDIFDQAEEFFNSNEFVEALPLYHLLEKKEIRTANISYRIGACYLNIRGKKDRAIPYLENACKSVNSQYESRLDEENAPLKALLLLGVAYRIDNQLDKAIGMFTLLRDSVQKIDPEFVTVIDMHIERCNNAKMLNAFPGEPRTERLPDQINTVFSNYNPVLVGHDSVLYYMEERKFYDAIMRVELHGETWGEPENMTPVLGSDGDHVLVGADAAGDQLFLSFYEPLKAGEIYETHRNAEGKWTPITPLNENINTPFHETHASLSPDGKTLYFTSNRNGGIGGLDIYKSELDENNEWGPAQNLGDQINTPYNEETPIINSDDEILYFSSQGHMSMGGFDIFYALRKGDNEWRRPINMGAPVSTTDDDLFYYPLEEHVSGLMARLENPVNGYDIYRYNSMVFANSPRFSVKGKVPDVDTSNFKEYSLAIVQKGKPDTLSTETLTPDGKYDLLLPAGDFDIVVLHKQQAITRQELTLLDDAADEILLGSIAAAPQSESLVVDADTVSTPLKSPVAVADTFELRAIHYEFDQHKLTAEAENYLTALHQVLIRHPEVVLRIEGYTDDLGPEEYNRILSEKRAQAVQFYLVQKGIDRARLPIKGMGEQNPVAQNTFADGRGNLEGRKYNRRVVLIPVNQGSSVRFVAVETVPAYLRMK